MVLVVLSVAVMRDEQQIFFGNDRKKGKGKSEDLAGNCS